MSIKWLFLLNLFQDETLSGIHFKVVIAGINTIITSTLITTDESDKSYPVNELGVRDLRMKAGAHSITVTALGFATYSGVVMVSGHYAPCYYFTGKRRSCSYV